MPDSKELTEARETIAQLLVPWNTGYRKLEETNPILKAWYYKVVDKILNLHGSNWHIEVVKDKGR